MVGAISAAMVMGASAFFNTTPVTTTTTASAGTPSLQVQSAASDCTTGLNTVNSGDSQTVANMYPGFVQTECLIVTNNGPIPLNVYSKNTSVTDTDSGALAGALTYQIVDNGNCNAGGPAAPNVAAYTNGNGWHLATLAPGGVAKCLVTLALPDNHSDQSALEGKTATILNSIFGSTD